MLRIFDKEADVAYIYSKELITAVLLVEGYKTLSQKYVNFTQHEI